jgi:hypothetical protein
MRQQVAEDLRLTLFAARDGFSARATNSESFSRLGMAWFLQEAMRGVARRGFQ